MDKLSLQDIERLPGEMLTPAQVAGVLEMNPYTINVMAAQQPDAFGFPVMLLGNRVKIPKQPFLLYMRGESAKQAMDRAMETLTSVEAKLDALSASLDAFRKGPTINDHLDVYRNGGILDDHLDKALQRP